MEIKFNEKEVKEIVLAHAKKFFPDANTVEGESYSSVRSVVVSYVPPDNVEGSA